jgi:hypothetical protein
VLLGEKDKKNDDILLEIMKGDVKVVNGKVKEGYDAPYKLSMM